MDMMHHTVWQNFHLACLRTTNKKKKTANNCTFLCNLIKLFSFHRTIRTVWRNGTITASFSWPRPTATCNNLWQILTVIDIFPTQIFFQARFVCFRSFVACVDICVCWIFKSERSNNNISSNINILRTVYRFCWFLLSCHFIFHDIYFKVNVVVISIFSASSSSFVLLNY